MTVTGDGVTSEPIRVDHDPGELTALRDENEQLRKAMGHQEVAIRALRERLFEVEIELVNTRCEVIRRDHG